MFVIPSVGYIHVYRRGRLHHNLLSMCCVTPYLLVVVLLNSDPDVYFYCTLCNALVFIYARGVTPTDLQCISFNLCKGSNSY